MKSEKIKVGCSFQLSSGSGCVVHSRDFILPLLMAILLILWVLSRSYVFDRGEILISQLLLDVRSSHCKVSIFAVQQIFCFCTKLLSRLWNGVGAIVLQEITTINFSFFSVGSLMKDCRDPHGPPVFVSFVIWMGIGGKATWTCTAFQVLDLDLLFRKELGERETLTVTCFMNCMFS